jgi:hypothetical protein
MVYVVGIEPTTPTVSKKKRRVSKRREASRRTLKVPELQDDRGKIGGRTHGAKRKGDAERSTHLVAMMEPVYLGLRERVIGLRGTEAQPQSSLSGGAWGLLMDLAQEKYIATIVALANGHASLYLSSGGCASAGDERPGANDAYAPIWSAAKAAVKVADDSITLLQPTTEYPLPPPGDVAFYVLTDGGVYSATTHQDDLVSGRQPLIQLYAAGQNVLTQIRLAKEAGAFNHALIGPARRNKPLANWLGWLSRWRRRPRDTG